MWISLNVTVNFCFTLQHKKMTGGRVGEADSLGAASKYLLKGGGRGGVQGVGEGGLQVQSKFQNSW